MFNIFKRAKIVPATKLDEEGEKKAEELQSKLQLLSHEYPDIPMVFLSNVRIVDKSIDNCVDYCFFNNVNLIDENQD